MLVNSKNLTYVISISLQCCSDQYCKRGVEAPKKEFIAEAKTEHGFSWLTVHTLNRYGSYRATNWLSSPPKLKTATAKATIHAGLPDTAFMVQRPDLTPTNKSACKCPVGFMRTSAPATFYTCRIQTEHVLGKEYQRISAATKLS